MRGRLEAKVALVTGGSSGIGRASSLAFAREGAKVIIADVDVEGGEETARLVKAAGSEAIFVRADVSKVTEVEALVAKAVAAYGRLDCAHNNAGINGLRAPIADCTEKNWDSVIGINLKGIWLCMKYEIRQMLRQSGGAIVNTASIAGLIASLADLPAYVASKHGVIGLTKAAAVEYGRAGIRVNALCPGAVITPLFLGSFGDDTKAIEGMTKATPIGRLASPEDVAEAVIWLCSAAASFITGHAMPVDGGRTAH